MKLDNLNWDIVPARFTEVRLAGGFRPRFVDPITLDYTAELTAFERHPDLVHGKDTAGLVPVEDWEVVATRPIEDKAEYWIRRAAVSHTGFDGPYTRAGALEQASSRAKIHARAFTVVRIIPVLEVSVGDVLVKGL